MNNDSIRMRDKQAAADPTIQGDIGAGHDAPEPVAQHDDLAQESCNNPGSLAPMLIAADRQQQFSAGIPELSGVLPCPVRDLGADLRVNPVHASIKGAARSHSVT